MATKDLNDIDAQIRALMEKKKELKAKEKEKEKKEKEARQKNIGATVEKVLGKVTDMDSFKAFLLENKDKFMQGKDKDQPVEEAAPDAEDTVVDFT